MTSRNVKRVARAQLRIALAAAHVFRDYERAAWKEWHRGIGDSKNPTKWRLMRQTQVRIAMGWRKILKEL